jgi:hypothetical protein
MLSPPSMKSAGNQIARSIFVTPGNDVAFWKHPTQRITTPIGCRNFTESGWLQGAVSLIRQQSFLTNRIEIRDGASGNDIKIP